MRTNGTWRTLTVAALVVSWVAPAPAAYAGLPAGVAFQSAELHLRTRVVRCPEQQLQPVLETAAAGDRILIVGTCAERVRITSDDLVLAGNGKGALDGGGGGPAEFAAVITVDGSRRVTLSGLTVRNGPGEGVLVRGGGSVTLRNVTAENNGFTGVAVIDGSVATLRDVEVRGNAVGLDVVSGSVAVVQGHVVASGNGGGVDVNGQSVLEIRGGELSVVNNFGPGIVAGSSQIGILGYTRSQVPGSRLTVTGNGAFGIGLPNSSLEILGGTFEGSGANVVTASDNGGPGIWIPTGGSLASPFGTARFVIEGNPVGIDLGNGTEVTSIGGLAIHGNGVGIQADGADLTLVSIPPNPSAITDNGIDVSLSFGARATFGGADVGTLACDGSVMVRGSAACP